MIFGLFRRRVQEPPARAVYEAIMAGARQPALFLDHRVPDTIDGRYEMLVLHAFLYLHRLKKEDQAARARGQEVFDFMFLDMDRALRESGVGDLSVPKKIKKMAEVFYGRTGAYDAALDADDGDALAEALARNVYPDTGEDAALLSRRLASYVMASARVLKDQGRDDLLARGPVYADPAAAASVS